MNTDFRHWSKAVEPMMAINNAMLNCAQEVARCQMNLWSDCIGMAIKQSQMPLQKKPEDWVRAQMDMGCEMLENAVNAMRQSAEMMMETATACRCQCENIMKHQCHSTKEAAHR